MTKRFADELQNLSLCEAADLIKTGEVSAVETLAACFEQIDRLNPVHHAFVWQDRESAMAHAEGLDANRSAGRIIGLLHGIPMAHKDMYYRTGRISACGSRIRNDERPKTATVLQKLDSAGAVDVGGLAMVEFAMGPHGFNAHLPRVLNPWSHDRVPCGSSSGSGVAVACRMVYASLGSDTGGSIRCPAAANGIVGLLPTNGLVSRQGAMPMSFTLDCVGPLTRTVKDAARFLQVIAGPDATHSTSGGMPIPDYERDIEGALSGVRIGVPEGHFDRDLDPDVAKVVSGSLDVLRDAGAILVPIQIPETLSVASDLHPLVMKAEGSANHKPWKRTRSDVYSDEVGKRLEAGFFIPATDYINALQYRVFALEDILQSVFSKVDVLHTSVLPVPTPTLLQTAYSNGPAYLQMVVALTRNTRVINFLGLPALAVTCGYTSDGMPTSFQLVGRPFSESLLFRVGHRYQMETKIHLDIPRALGGAGKPSEGLAAQAS